MPAAPPQIKRALEIMGQWLGLPETAYKPSVYLFARQLPPHEVLEAVEIAQARLPAGGRQACRYFCGVCWRKIEEHRAMLEWE